MNNYSNIIYLVFTTQGAGGAEKRLTGAWLHLKNTGLNLRLVCSEELYTALCIQTEFENLTRYKNDVFFIPFTGNLRGDSKKLKKFIDSETKQGDKLHFVGSYPVILRPKKGVHYMYSLTTCSLNNLNIRGKIHLLLSIARSNKTDILDPIIFARVTRLFFYKKKNIFQTSSSYVDAKKYLPSYPKKNWIVFLGRFLEGKQILRYVDALPHINRKIVDAGITDHHFHIVGYGPQSEEVQAKLKQKVFRNIPITVQRSHTPEEILTHSKIFLSLNAENNYPSKSLLEGLAAGNIPVVTDVGTTEMIAPRSLSRYIPKSFTAEELADAIITILRNDEQSAKINSEKARDFVIETYNLDKMAAYYLNFYGK